MPTNKSVPAFLAKLYSMVNVGEGIRWAEGGRAFIIADPNAFADQQLSIWFSHIQFGSFVRQLNMYDFHKIPSDVEGDISVTFQHEFFRQGEPDMLNLIERKKPTSRSAPPSIKGGSDTRRRQPASRPAKTLHRRSATNLSSGRQTSDPLAAGPSAPPSPAASLPWPIPPVAGSEPPLDLDSILGPPSFPPSISNEQYDHTRVASTLLALPTFASLQLPSPGHFLPDPHVPHLPLAHTYPTPGPSQTNAVTSMPHLPSSTPSEYGQDRSEADMGNSKTVDFFFPA